MAVPAALVLVALAANVGESQLVPGAGEAPRELPPFASRGALAIRTVSPSAARVGRYEKLELTVDLSATYDSPFDPEQVEVGGVFTAPSGASTPVDGFWCQPYRAIGCKPTPVDGARAWVPGLADAEYQVEW